MPRRSRRWSFAVAAGGDGGPLSAVATVVAFLAADLWLAFSATRSPGFRSSSALRSEEAGPVLPQTARIQSSPRSSRSRASSWCAYAIRNVGKTLPGTPVAADGSGKGRRVDRIRDPRGERAQTLASTGGGRKCTRMSARPGRPRDRPYAGTSRSCHLRTGSLTPDCRSRGRRLRAHPGPVFSAGLAAERLEEGGPSARTRWPESRPATTRLPASALRILGSTSPIWPTAARSTCGGSSCRVRRPWTPREWPTGPATTGDRKHSWTRRRSTTCGETCTSGPPDARIDWAGLTDPGEAALETWGQCGGRLGSAAPRSGLRIRSRRSTARSGRPGSGASTHTPRCTGCRPWRG